MEHVNTSRLDNPPRVNNDDQRKQIRPRESATGEEEWSETNDRAPDPNTHTQYDEIDCEQMMTRCRQEIKTYFFFFWIFGSSGGCCPRQSPIGSGGFPQSKILRKL
jgi:hypothetical protein